MRRRDGFTLIELVVTMVVLAILASIAILKYRGVKERSMSVTLQGDLRVLSLHQELYHSHNQRYTSTVSSLDMIPSHSVTLNVTVATGSGWAAQATHAGHPGHMCGIYVGTATAADGAPATTPNTVGCDGP